MGRYRITFTRGELKGKLGYRVSDCTLTFFQFGDIRGKKFIPPILKKNIDWYETKLGNTFFYKSSLKKLEKYLKDKDKKKLISKIK